MPRLSSLRDEPLQANGTIPPQAGTYAYGLNLFLAATNGIIAINSKRVECRFELTSICSAFMISVASYSIILGTERVNWFSDFVRVETIMGDGALPHFLPEPMVIEKGDFIVCTARNDNTTAKRIALIFQGVHF